MGYDMNDMKGLVDESAAHRPEWSSFKDEFIYAPRAFTDALLDWWGDCWGLVLGVAAIVVPVAFLIYFGIQEGREWDAFAREHDCREFAERRGPDSTIFIHSGEVMIPVTTSTTETGYRCNDGREYWR